MGIQQNDTATTARIQNFHRNNKRVISLNDTPGCINTHLRGGKKGTPGHFARLFFYFMAARSRLCKKIDNGSGGDGSGDKNKGNCDFAGAEWDPGPGPVGRRGEAGNRRRTSFICHGKTNSPNGLRNDGCFAEIIEVGVLQVLKVGIVEWGGDEKRKAPRIDCSLSVKQDFPFLFLLSILFSFTELTIQKYTKNMVSCIPDAAIFSFFLFILYFDASSITI